MAFDPEETYLWGLKSRSSIFVLSVVSIISFLVDLIFQVRFDYKAITSSIIEEKMPNTGDSSNFEILIVK